MIKRLGNASCKIKAFLKSFGSI